METMQEAWYAARTISTKNHKYKRFWLADKYNYMTSTKAHNNVWGIDDRKGLADGIERLRS